MYLGYKWKKCLVFSHAQVVKPDTNNLLSFFSTNLTRTAVAFPPK